LDSAIVSLGNAVRRSRPHTHVEGAFDRSLFPDDGPAYFFDLDGTITRAKLLPIIGAEIGLLGLKELTDQN